MTLKEKMKQLYPDKVSEKHTGGVLGCPHQYKELNILEEEEWKFCQGGDFCNRATCFTCWNQKWRENEQW